MELDERIIEGKKPLTCFDIDEAEKYVGKKCYISNEYDFFRNLDFTKHKILNGVEDCEAPFHYDSDSQAEFCLPEEWVMPKKKWRAYTIAEFQETFTVGRAVRFRRKDAPTKEHLLAFGGYYTFHDGRVSILFGIHLYTLEELFEQYEWQEFYTDEYRPFGVEE